MQIRHLLVLCSVLSGMALPVAAQSCEKNLPSSVYSEMVEAAQRAAQRQDGFTGSINWRDGSGTGFYGQAAPVGSTYPNGCRGVTITLNYEHSGRDQDARFDLLICPDRSGAGKVTSWNQSAGRDIPDLCIPEATRYTNSVGDQCVKDPARGTDTCIDSCGRSYSASSGRPRPPAPKSSTYTNDYGDRCTRTTTFAFSSCTTVESVDSTCTASDGSSYADPGSRPAPKTETFTNSWGDRCQRRTETELIDGRPVPSITEVCTSRNGTSYSNEDGPSPDPALIASIRDLLTQLRYLTRAPSGAYDLETNRAIMEFLSDESITDPKTDLEVRTLLTEAIRRTTSLRKVECTLVPDDAEKSRTCIAYK